MVTLSVVLSMKWTSSSSSLFYCVLLQLLLVWRPSLCKQEQAGCTSAGTSEAVAYFERPLAADRTCGHVESAEPCIVMLNVSREVEERNNLTANLMLNVHMDNEETYNNWVVVIVSKTPLHLRVVVMGKRKGDLPIVLTHKMSRVVASNVALRVLHPSVDSGFEEFGPTCVRAETKDANRVSLVLKRDAIQECSTNGNKQNEVISAFRASKQSVKRCSRDREECGLDVLTLILDVNEAGLSSKEGSGPIYVSLTFPPSHSSYKRLNVVLRCNQSVHWVLQPSAFSPSKLLVYIDSSSSIDFKRSQTLTEVRKLNALSSFGVVTLKRRIGESDETGSKFCLGRMRHFVVSRANIVSVKLSDVDKEAELGYHRTPTEAGRLPNTIRTDEIHSLIEDAMLVQCSQVETVVTLDAKITDRLGVSGAFLDDSSCKGDRNDTHWTLRTGSTSCGSLTLFGVGRSARFRNHVHLVMGNGVKESIPKSKPLSIPFTCDFSPSLKGSSEDNYDDDNQDIGEMYHLHIKSAESGLNLRSRNDEGQLQEGDAVTVSTVFNSRIFLKLAMESCWLSQDPQDDFGMSGNSVFLLSNGCPDNTELNVALNLDKEDPSFNFEVPKKELFAPHGKDNAEFYIFCVMGLCSPTNMVTANLAQCSNASQLCHTKQALPHRPPSAQQVTRRGPIKVIPRQQASRSSESSLLSSLSSSHVVMVGVPAEVAGIVAMLSFVIGVCITAMLCCLHQRKSRKSQLNKDPKHCGYPNNNGHLDCSELQSMLARVPTTTH